MAINLSLARDFQMKARVGGLEVSPTYMHELLINSMSFQLRNLVVYICDLIVICDVFSGIVRQK